MSLKDTINNDIKEAMKAKDRDTLEALRAVKSAILNAETAKGGGEQNDQAEVALLQKLLKQRKDSANLYEEQGREDLAAQEKTQAEIISRYMPEQMSEDEIRKMVIEQIEKTGATGPESMGKVMGPLAGKLKGKADGSLISSIVKEELNK